MRPVRAFTLVEMLVVLAIIAVLVALILGVVQLGRRYAYRGTCMSNLRQLVAALKMYDENCGGPPPFHVAYSEWDKVQPEVKPILLCPADFTRGELTPVYLSPKPEKEIRSSYSPFFFLNELDCPSGWAPIPDAERMWFHCDWHSTRYTLVGFADGHVKAIDSALTGQYANKVRELCPTETP